MSTHKSRKSNSRSSVDQRMMALLILTVALVLLVLILSNSQSWLVALSVIIILTTLILVVGEASHQIPNVLKIILSEMGQILTMLEIFTLIFTEIKRIFAAVSDRTKRQNDT